MTGKAIRPGLAAPLGEAGPSGTPVSWHKRSAVHQRLAGLDGLRALAIGGVLLYHGDLAWLPGGFLGVDLFFVLSGFLVTALLLDEHTRHGRIDIPGFYGRRLRRLFPALAVLLGALLAVVPVLAPEALPRTERDTVPALFYAANWWFIFNQGSYFEFIGRPPLLQHLWSLAIEEQFYLLWPCALWALLRAGKQRWVLAASLGMAGASTGWMAFLAVSGLLPEAGDPSRLYFGTDTHCMGLFVGSALAAVARPFSLTAGPVPRRRVLVRDLVGGVALSGLLVAFLWLGEQQAMLYRGGFLAVALLGAALILATLTPGSCLTRLLECRALRWAGQRSYGLYLWHWPVFMLTRPELDTPLDGPANLLLRLLLVGLVAELSFRLVEDPIRRGLFSRWHRAGVQLLNQGSARVVLASLLASTPAVAALVLSSSPGGAFPQRTAAAGLPADIAQALGMAGSGELLRGSPGTGSRAVIAASSAPAATTPRLPPTETGPETRLAAVTEMAVVTEVTLPRLAPLPSPASAGSVTSAGVLDEPLTAIGDSVLLGARPQLEKVLPQAQTDAEIGRQAAALVVRLQALKENNLLARKVILHLGTNGYVTEKQLRAALETLGDRERIILVNARAPRRWVADNNSLMERVVAEYPNVVLADWAALADDHPEYFVSDGIHLSQAGQRAFVDGILRVGGFTRGTQAAGTVLDAPLNAAAGTPEPTPLATVGVGAMPAAGQVDICSSGVFWAAPEELAARRVPVTTGLDYRGVFDGPQARQWVAALGSPPVLEEDSAPDREDLPASWHCLGGFSGGSP